MDAKALELDGKECGFYMCGSCGRIWVGAYKKQTAPDPEARRCAEECCACKQCGKPLEKPQSSFGYHDPCWKKFMQETWAKQLVRALEVTDYDGWVFNDGPGGGSQEDGYSMDMDSLVEHLQIRLDDGALEIEDWPKFVLCCKPCPAAKIDIADIVERMVENLYDDAEDDIEGLGELEKVLEKFNAANAHLVSYVPDYSRKIAVPGPEARTGDKTPKEGD